MLGLIFPSTLVASLVFSAGSKPQEETALFLFQLRGVSVGTIELSLDRGEGRYRYRSSHLYARASDRTWVVRSGGFTVDEQLQIVGTKDHPESLWLWRKPQAKGCVRVREELGSKVGQACVSELFEQQARGTLYGEPYQARYLEGWLSELTLGQSRFVVVPPTARLSDSEDLFSSGFRVRGKPEGTLFLRPRPVPADDLTALTPWNEQDAKALAQSVRSEFQDKRPSAQDLVAGSATEVVFAGSCLAHAKRFVARAGAMGQRVAIVQGLFVEPGASRAFAHAWVRVRTGKSTFVDLDPTFDSTVRPRTHLPLHAAIEGGDQVAGQWWLQLLAGRYEVVRG